VSYDIDPRVDGYIAQLPDWQQAICQEVRELVHHADPEVVETIKRTVQPYFVLDGNICALLAAKDHVNVFLYDGGIVPDPEGIITAGHGNSTARTVSYREHETDKCLGPGGNVPADHRQQPGRRLAKDQGRQCTRLTGALPRARRRLLLTCAPIACCSMSNQRGGTSSNSRSSASATPPGRGLLPGAQVVRDDFGA
jgi:hypothetical protein